jgi:high-affinity K+ transport system ATPase subunit B
MSAEALLRRNLLIYGLGGIVVPFIGIKIIDVIIHDGRACIVDSWSAKALADRAS